MGPEQTVSGGPVPTATTQQPDRNVDEAVAPPAAIAAAEVAPLSEPVKPADPRISTVTGIERKAEDAPVVAVPPAPIPTERKIVAKGDNVTLTATADKEGRIRLNKAGWERAEVLRPGQVLELRWEHGQVVASTMPERK